MKWLEKNLFTEDYASLRRTNEPRIPAKTNRVEYKLLNLVGSYCVAGSMLGAVMSTQSDMSLPEECGIF